MLEEKNNFLNIPTIESTYIIFKNNNDIIDNKIPLHTNILISNENTIDKLFLQNTNIINIIKGRDFKINEKIYMVQRYLHNELNLSYKDIINIEILYSQELEETKSIFKYPIEEKSIDFKSTILDTFIDCDLDLNNNTNKMYILVMISSDPNRKIIGELVNRYLFIENRENEEYNESLQPRPFRELENMSYNYLFSYISRRIEEIDEQREIDLNIIRDSFINRLNRTNVHNYTYRHYNSINNEILNEESHNERFNEESHNERLYNERLNEILNEESYNERFNERPNNQRTNLLMDNLFNLLVYVNPDSINVENIEHLFEPVRVTIDEKDMAIFLTSFKYNEILQPEELKNIKVKDQTICSICISNYENEEMVSYLNTCNHLFHTTCINKWLTDFNHKCPVCRLSANPVKND